MRLRSLFRWTTSDGRPNDASDDDAMDLANEGADGGNCRFATVAADGADGAAIG